MMRRPRILAVDDDADSLALLEITLSSANYDVVTATHGEAALAAVGQAPTDLVLLDMWMPVLDGWGFVRAYRARPGPHAPIVVVSAVRHGERLAAEVDADSYLDKPCRLEELLGLVGRYTRPEGMAPNPTQSGVVRTHVLPTLGGHLEASMAHKVL